MNRDVYVQLPDGRTAIGETLGIHLEHDLALIRLRDSGPWPFISVGQRSSLKVGSWCAALGHPGGCDLDRGPVLRLGRVLQHDSLLRSDCQLIGGDSGGPLVDMNGQVIGIHSRIGTSLANNLHIPVDVIRDHWKELTSGTIARGVSFIGVRGGSEGSSSGPRCEITAVTPDSPAARAGIRQGDIVTHFAGQRVYNFAELVMLVQMRKPGDPVTLKVQRDGQELDVLVRIGRRRQPERET
jgi:serine protease Do